ncbi:hypothetical protein [Ruegeria sp. YS9]|uniref:hypothetical protein n=1 Tax=Ruegeria sp. YS9 TaxID=2966453 RepID=UPI00214C7D88|nr:hypothetical protein [Ruegeria sp. YS9]UUV08257.1 hypothetical protein NOR97_16985 [Ruegeria sp. YS9]
MAKVKKNIDTVRVSRAGHTFHERWAARRALQLVFPKDDLFAIVVEGLSPTESLNLGSEAEDIADLILYYGGGDNFETCSSQQILQFKYKEAAEPVTSSYLKKTIKKFSATLRSFKAKVDTQEVAKKLSFGFVTNAEFSDDLWQAIGCLKTGKPTSTKGAKSQLQYLKIWCEEEHTDAEDIFPLIEFRAGTNDLPTQNRSIRRTISDWSANSTGQAAKRLFALVELVREKSQIEGQANNSIRREDVLDALECDEDQLFPADTRFVDVGEVVARDALGDVKDKVLSCDLPVFLHAEGGVGKTVFIQSFAACLTGVLEVVVFDCFGGGAYRSEAQARHLPRMGLLQIVNELASRGLCDPLLPTDSDQYGLIELARKRLSQAAKTIKSQSSLQGILIVLDAADNAQMEADIRGEASFPKLLLASLSSEPIDGVKLMLTARPHRMDGVVGNSRVERVELAPFSKSETKRFLETRREAITSTEFAVAFSRSRGNARVLEYLVESWAKNVSNNAPDSEILVEELIAQKCNKIFRDLHTAGWNDVEVCEFFAALSLLPPPIPLDELAAALGWSVSQVNSAASDLAPMLELVKHGAIFRDEPTETHIKDNYASEYTAQQSIAERLQRRQKDSIYAAEALPHFLVVIGDSERAYQLSGSNVFPDAVETEYGRRVLKLARLHAAYSLATRDNDLDRVLRLTVQLSQVASANARGDQFIRRSPSLAMFLGDTDASRRLFNDRSGWRGARDTRLTVAYSFTEDFDEARIHQNRAIGWINWHLHNDDETTRFQRTGFEAFDVAAVMFFSVLKGELSSLNRNIQIWNFRFALSVIEKLIALCSQHKTALASNALAVLADFAASKRCLSLPLQIGLLKQDCGLTVDEQRAISRAASALALRYKKKVPEDQYDHEKELQGAISSAALTALIVNSRQSAKRLLSLYQPKRPSSYDYAERHGLNRVWMPVQSSCLAAWSSGKQLSFHNLMPDEVKIGRKTKSIGSDAELREYLDGLVTTKTHERGRKLKQPEKRKKFSSQERDEIVKGVSCVLKLVKPLEKCVLSKKPISNDVLMEFLATWKPTLRPDVHWRAETGRDNVARHVGIGLAKTILRHCEFVKENEARELIAVIESNRFSVSDKLGILTLLAWRANLSDIVGNYAAKVAEEIVADDYIEQRGESYRELATSLLSLSVDEAKSYYAQGLAQLDQMGGDDHDLIYSAMLFAEKQHGGFVKPELSHRFMGLCQTIFQHEPSKFGWALFGRAASTSIGFPAFYKLMRWNDQDVVDYSYGLPQFACYLAKAGQLDPRRAAIMLAVCEDHGWHEWEVGQGLDDLLSAAAPEDKRAIFTAIMEKLEREHSFGGWEGLWKSLVECVDAHEEINDDALRDRLVNLRKAARKRQDIENAQRNNSNRTSPDRDLQELGKKKDEAARELAISAICADCNFVSSASLDEAFQKVQSFEGFPYDNKNRLFQKIVETCPYGERKGFLEALCETTELEFDNTLDLMIECIEAWRSTSAHVQNGIRRFVETLFAFKGSGLFDLRYTGISRQIHRLSTLCGDSKFVLQIVLETIAKERLELSGDEWLQIATNLSSHTEAKTALEALEELLSGSAANVGDEIGEGAYRAAFAGKGDEIDVTVDLIWHLLGDSDAYVRWNAARSIKTMLDMGLVEDIERLLDRFDVDQNASLASKEHYFAFMNAQQWLLMGLSRAAPYHANLLRPVKARLLTLAQRDDLHVINKLHLARCIQHVEGLGTKSSELSDLWKEVQVPHHGFIERTDWPEQVDRRIEFGFDYDFMDHKVSKVARLFNLSNGEANDAIATEVIKRWPNTKNMSEFPGHARYRGDERYETYREHIQRHAQLHAVTTLARMKPVIRQSYDWEESDPWKEFLKDRDVSFEDGSWLSDHKDRVPSQALERFLGDRIGDQETLQDKETLFHKIGLGCETESSFLPIYGRWTSPDGVCVSLSSALVKTRGAVGQCAKFSKSDYHDLWLPMFRSDGYFDRHRMNKPFSPLICDPEYWSIGIDDHDEYAARGAIARPKLGRNLNKFLELKHDDDKREWHSREGALTIKSEVWGEWVRDPDNHRSRYQNEGSTLWAESNWLNEALASCKCSIVFKIDFTKYKSSKSYDESSGVKAIYIGLKRSGQDPRFWFAKKASQTMY